MTKARMTGLKNNLMPGENIDLSNFKEMGHGRFGFAVEKELSDRGHDINKGAGPDLPQYGNVEVKTGNEDSRSPHSVSTVSPATIMNTPWAGSTLQKKTLNQLRVKWKTVNSNTAMVTSSDLFNFSYNHIQSKLEEDYEHARRLVINGISDAYISGPNDYLHLQKQKRKNGHAYQIRIGNAAMKKMESFTKKASSLRENFDWGQSGL